MPEIQIIDNSLQVEFSNWSLANYALFLKCKNLPESELHYDYKKDAYTVSAPARYRQMLQISIDDLKSGNQRIFIYGLIDPRTNQIRYIGQSVRPKERLTNHCNEKAHCHRAHWIQSLARDGLKPILLILDTVEPGADWRCVERDWIAYGRTQGWPLTNNTDGGDGVRGLPPETRERMRQNWLGRKHKPDSLVKIGQASRGRHHTEAHKQKLRERFRDRYFSPETRRRLSLGNRKLLDDQVRDIRRMLAEGITPKVIAEIFHVHPDTVTNIEKRKYYADVPDLPELL